MRDAEVVGECGLDLDLVAERVRRAYVLAGVGGAAVHIKSEVLHGFAGGNRLNLAHNLEPSALELRPKLSSDGIRAILIRLLEGASDSAVHRRRNDCDSEQNRRGKQ